jgi:hypothetical protein
LFSNSYLYFWKNTHDFRSFGNTTFEKAVDQWSVSFVRREFFPAPGPSARYPTMGQSGCCWLQIPFSQKMGQSLKDFFTTIRMNTASELLKEKSVTKVAEIMGYSSVQAFTRAYKSAKNISPSKIFKT